MAKCDVKGIDLGQVTFFRTMQHERDLCDIILVLFSHYAK